jgi:hypothetical protein
MLEGSERDGYTLSCDAPGCDTEVDDLETFMEGVQYKKDNGWRSIKGQSGCWHEICPACKTDNEIVQRFKDM